ncbi:MAG TPA: hypothetical protein PK402_14815, partial [Tepidisphaeraceae bacterium]|nr:hypothetical protein [Tepidisphaeraceae bacterium]
MRVSKRLNGVLLPFLTGLFLASVAAPASAAWTVTNLHPLGEQSSRGFGAAGAQQVGWTSSSFGQNHASLWSGSAG